jgi:CDP-diacylglycerol--serine O-phosphatidyltransferase
MRTRRLTPEDLITLCNGVIGLVVVALVVADPWEAPGSGAPDQRLLEVCIVLLVLGGVLDALDGAMARRHGGGPWGTWLDAGCDLITFGVAPAALIVAGSAGAGAWRMPLILAATAYLVVAAFRLARHAAHSSPGQPFQGLPMPSAAAAVVAILLLEQSPPVEVAALAAVCALMASTLPYPRPSRRTAPALVLFAAALGASLAGLIPIRAVALAWLAALALVALRAVVLQTVRRASLRWPRRGEPRPRLRPRMDQ